MQEGNINQALNMGRVRDMPVHTYTQKQLNEVSAKQVELAAALIRPAGNFFYNGKNWEPNAYPGYAVVAMVDNNPGNNDLSLLLTDLQSELTDNLQPVNSFYMLPPDSFHQTIANTLSADKFKTNILFAGLNDVYPRYIGTAFKNTYVTRQENPIRMRLIGLSVFGTAIGVLGVFERDADYKRITDFRSGFYEDAQLNQLDVKMTRPFIGHITLAYAERKLNKNQRSHLANTINEINDRVFAKKQYFLISQAELRQYDHLAEFKTAADYPAYSFTL